MVIASSSSASASLRDLRECLASNTIRPRGVPALPSMSTTTSPLRPPSPRTSPTASASSPWASAIASTASATASS